MRQGAYNRAMKSLHVSVLAGVCLAAACGGASAGSTSENPAAAASGRGRQCLEDAAAPRQPRADAPTKITVSHILVRHAELERPEGATRSREAACLRALDALERLRAGADWAEVVKKYSDAGRDVGGLLGSVARDELDPSFADAAFALDVKELSYVVESKRGFHVILRTE